MFEVLFLLSVLLPGIVRAMESINLSPSTGQSTNMKSNSKRHVVVVVVVVATVAGEYVRQGRPWKWKF